MSRIGKAPVPIPAGVTVETKAREVSVKGPKGNLGLTLRPEIDVAVEGNVVQVSTNGSGPARQARAFHEPMKVNIPTVSRGARHSGKRIWKRKRRCPAPSIRAESHSSPGRPRRNWRSRKMLKALAMKGMVSAGQLFNQANGLLRCR